MGVQEELSDVDGAMDDVCSWWAVVVETLR
jgi:hypothetical protein